MIRTLRSGGIAGVLLLIVLSGCGPTIKPFAAAGLIGGEDVSMAILPFDNLSSTQGAGKSLESMVLVEFLKRSTIKVVDPGEVSAALSKERIRLATNMSKETIRALGTSLGVKLLMMGIVHQYEMQGAATGSSVAGMPLIAVTLRIVNAASGDIVWACTTTRRGNDRETVFGIGKVVSLDTLAEQIAAELAQAFADSLRKNQSSPRAAAPFKPVAPADTATPKKTISSEPPLPSGTALPKEAPSSEPITPVDTPAEKTPPSSSVPVTSVDAARPEAVSSGPEAPSDAAAQKAPPPGTLPSGEPTPNTLQSSVPVMQSGEATTENSERGRQNPAGTGI